jgi:hypothetical protein
METVRFMIDNLDLIGERALEHISMSSPQSRSRS